MDVKTIEMLLLVLMLIFAVLFILLICVLPALCIMEKEKQRKKIMETSFPKLQE